MNKYLFATVLAAALIAVILHKNPVMEHVIRGDKQDEIGAKAIKVTNLTSKHIDSSSAKTLNIMEQVKVAFARYAITGSSDELLDLFKKHPDIMIRELTDRGCFELIGFYQGILLKEKALDWLATNLDPSQRNRAYEGYAASIVATDHQKAITFMQGLDIGITRDRVTNLILTEICKENPQEAWKCFLLEHDNISQGASGNYTNIANSIIGEMMQKYSSVEFAVFLNSEEIKTLKPYMMVDITSLVSSKYPSEAIDLLQHISKKEYRENAIGVIGTRYFTTGNSEGLQMLVERMNDTENENQIMSIICGTYFSDGNDSGIYQMSKNKETKYDYVLFKTAAGLLDEKKVTDWINNMQQGARRDGLIDGMINGPGLSNSKSGETKLIQKKPFESGVSNRSQSK